jgi:hypothetical protein
MTRNLRLLILLGASLLVGGCSRPASPVQAADQFFASISQGQLEKAYDSASFAFRAEQSVQSFQATARDVGLMGGKGVAKWTRTLLTGDEAKLEGIIAGGGANIAVSVTLIRERGQWRLFALRTPAAQSGDAAPTENRFTLVGKGAGFSTAVNRPAPSEDVSRQLVEDNLVMFNDAVQRHNFADFYANVSYSWQRQLTLHQLQAAFQPFIDAGKNLGPIRSLTAVFDEPPHINSEGVLVLNGHYPPQPYTINFALRFVYELPSWKLFWIDVRLTK